MSQEYFPLVNEEGKTIGKATRKECHSGSKMLHPVVHLHIFNDNGDLYLQKRSMRKDIQPGKWDTAVGGHLDPGEGYLEGALRELREELGVTVEKEARQRRNVLPAFSQGRQVQVYGVDAIEQGTADLRRRLWIDADPS